MYPSFLKEPRRPFRYVGKHRASEATYPSPRVAPVETEPDTSESLALVLSEPHEFELSA